jgi:transposase-like protein
VKYLSNIVERDHRRIKRLTRLGLGFGTRYDKTAHNFLPTVHLAASVIWFN